MLKQKQSYVGHTVHAEIERPVKLAMLGVVEGRRGRPHMCWMNGVKSATKLSLLELWEAVQDGDVWRNLIMYVTKHWRRLGGT